MCKTVSQPEPQTRPHVNCGMEKNLICSISEFLEAKHNAYVPKEKRTKWDSHSTEGVLVGYSETSTGYRILNPSTSKVTIHRDVAFDKGSATNEKFIIVSVTSDTVQSQPTSSSSTDDQSSVPDLQDNAQEDKCVDIEVDTDEVAVTERNQSNKEEPTVRRSTRQNKGVPAERLSYIARTHLPTEPASWKEIQKLPDPEKLKWTKAADEEIKSLKKLQTWQLTELPEGKQAIGSKWIFKIKRDSECHVDKYKARLVAKGFTQEYGKDYDATFAPVAKQSTFRTLLTVAAARNLKVRHYDIKTAFLNGDVTEDLYMSQPEGYVADGQEHLVCKLQRSVYGLKQSARAWNTKVNDILLQNKFVRSKSDPCLYSKFENNKWMYVLIYVDDLLIVHEDDEAITQFGTVINEHFALKDLGEISYYLGIQVERETDGSFLLSQSAKIATILDQFGMKDAKGASTPMDTAYPKLEGEYDCLPDNCLYRQAVGAILYIATTTRPDITAAMGILCRRVSNPRQRDWYAVKRIMRYLKHTADLKLKICADNNLELVGFADADWAGDIGDRKSTSGYLYKLGNSPVSWSSKKQSSVALSSTEAEYISAAYASQEAVWLRQLLADFGIPPTTATIMYEDNQGCIKLANNDKMNARTKHIDVRHHHLRDLINCDVINFVYCETNMMIADALTKPLPRPKFEELRFAIGLV